MFEHLCRLRFLFVQSSDLNALNAVFRTIHHHRSGIPIRNREVRNNSDNRSHVLKALYYNIRDSKSTMFCYYYYYNLLTFI